MEDLCKELSCPVCLELFTPPVLELPCAHNFCRKCIHLNLMISHGYTPGKGQFFCPLCRKVTYLKGKGLDGLKRNLFAENVLEKTKKQMKNDEEKQRRLKSQTCTEHEELKNLVCLNDKVLICGVCKLFGDHSTHEVVRLSDFYEEKKKKFTELMQGLVSKDEAMKQPTQQLKDFKDDLNSTSKEVKALINSLGHSMIKEIQLKVSVLKKMVDIECDLKVGDLNNTLRELEEPQQLFLKMQKLLQTHSSPAEFLEECTHLSDEAENRVQDDIVPPPLKKESISIGMYVEMLLTSVKIKKVSKSGPSSILGRLSEEYNAWRLGCSNVDLTSYDGLDQLIRDSVSFASLYPDSASSISSSEESSTDGDMEERLQHFF
ncbi:tripartite motif-containing protein 54-like [Amia ocellicauda]|uniref:tripartite motif-containing protein 54-like n=1 Tax=Amia ocellicauda TaxID=2972642 RepID=UPI003463A16A